MLLDVPSGRPSEKDGMPPGTSTKSTGRWNSVVQCDPDGGTFLAGSSTSCDFTLPDVRTRHSIFRSRLTAHPAAPAQPSQQINYGSGKDVNDRLRALGPRLKDHEIKDGDHEQTRSCTQYPPKQ